VQVYDTLRNEGFMLLTRGAETSELACDAIWAWWRRMGRYHYRRASRVLVLCDSGGSNGYRRHRFKQDLCELAADLGRDIQIAHYPPGCSKYNPIEHKLFCHVTRSLRATVLRTIEIARSLIARTKTVPGLRVVAEIAGRMYEKGRKATSEFLADMPLRFDAFLPQLNYTAPATYGLIE
jgi:DDE family transposase